MRKKLIIGNWKMNLNMQEASLYLHKLMEVLKPRRDVEVVVAPTTLTLQSLSLQINRRIARLAAQNCYWRDHGAYTGEVPAAHLRGIADYVLIGHSERRYIFIESDKDIRLKVQAAIRNRLQPILCVGETAQERALGETRDVLADQLTSGLANVTAEELDRIVIAYEPIWAIGTGKSASAEQIEGVLNFIREQTSAPLLYGGSVNTANIGGIVGIKNCDGVLVGTASWDALKFLELIRVVS